jgi:hypothetical protein
MGESRRPVAAQTNTASNREDWRYAIAAIATPPQNTTPSMRSKSSDEGERCALMMAAWSA